MKLSRTMSVEQLDRGYWYATELKAFAVSLGLPGGLRKDQLEAAIKQFLVSGKRAARTRKASGPADAVALDTVIRVYKNSPETKAFLEREAKRLDPAYRRRSGARYRLNRWREAHPGAKYRDLVREYVRLSTSLKPFAKVPVGRYINFLAEFLKAGEGTHAQARAAWHRLKKLDVEKTYAGWKSARAGL